MDETTKQLAAALRSAMQAELTGQTFYQNAAMTTQDPDGKKVFEQLAREEKEHFDFLAKHYNSVISTGKLSDELTLPGHSSVDGHHPIFSDQLRSRIKDAHFEMSALSIAVQLELNAINHYREQAQKATSSEVKKLFAGLAEWEQSHYEAFLNQQRELQDEFWTASGFSPF